MASLTFTLSGVPPSQNKRLHHMARYQQNKQWKDDTIVLLRDAINRSRVSGLPWPRVHVRYNFHYPRVTLADPDNLIGSMKPCLDGCKEIAFPDDNVTVIHDLSVRVDVLKKMPAGVTVVIDECRCDDNDGLTSVQTAREEPDLS
jgi:hypothetical protein